jgi:hypothetical protein
MACLLEGIVVEVPIVSVIMLDPHVMLGCELLEGALGGDCLN